MPRIVKKKEENVISYSVLDREENSDDFLNDPDLFRDPLPQPYRRIDKILQDVLDQAWSILESNEEERQVESSKYRPPKFSSFSIIDELENFNCTCASSDENEFVFVGLNGKLVCVDADQTCVVDQVDLVDEKTSESANIVEISSSKLRKSAYLVVSRSDADLVYLHLFVVNKFNPISFEIDSKFNCKKCELSDNCNFIGFYLETKANLSDCLIEVYKSPKEAWLQFADNYSQNELRKSVTTFRSENDNSALEIADNLSVHNEPVSTNQAAQPPSLPKPTILCKIKPPANLFKLQIQSNLNVNQLLKSVEANPDIIGLGVNNLFTKAHLELKTQVCEKFFNIQLNEEISSQINSGTTDAPSKIECNFRFMTSSRFSNQPAVFDQTTEVANNLSVCWNKSSQLLFYPLTKVTKDLESKMEYCLPFSASILTIKTSKCNSLIAVALANNNVVVFDLNTGVHRACVYFDDIGYIKRMAFMKPSVANRTFNPNTSAQFKIPADLLCLADNGNLYTVDCSLGNNTQTPKLIFKPDLGNKDDKWVDFFESKHLPSMVMVIGETKKMYMFDVLKTQLVCELDMNQNEYGLVLGSFQAAFASKDQFFLIKSECKEDGKSRLISHSLVLNSKLDPYFRHGTQFYENYLPANASLNDRMKNLIKIRSEEQCLRKERLKNVWVELQNRRNNFPTAK